MRDIVQRLLQVSIIELRVFIKQALEGKFPLEVCKPPGLSNVCRAGYTRLYARTHAVSYPALTTHPFFSSPTMDFKVIAKKVL